MMPQLDRILETVLYTADMTRARDFFENVLELRPLHAGDRMTAYAIGPSMLLLFQQGATDETVHLPKGMGTIPPHDGGGRQHLALAIGKDEMEDWTRHLSSHTVAIEGRTRWPRGGESIYFRDPDGHLLELATPGIWPVH